MAVQTGGVVSHRRHRVPAHLGRRAPAGVRILVDRQRALRPSHGEETLRPDCRRRDTGRPVWRHALRAGRSCVGRAVHAALPRRPPIAHGVARLAARIRCGTDIHAGIRRRCSRLLDYVFKARAVETLGTGDSLLRFFAMYYAATSLISFILQILASRAVLERFGVALTTSTPSIALLAGSVVGLVAPGFGSLIVARGGESVFRASWFRAGYELFYTPIPVAEKRAAKSVIDVAFDRLGDAAGGGLVRLVVLLVPAARSSEPERPPATPPGACRCSAPGHPCAAIGQTRRHDRCALPPRGAFGAAG